MTTLRIELDDATAATIKERADIAGKTPEALVAEIVAQQIAPPSNKEWIPKFLEAAKNSGGDSKWLGVES